MRFDQVPARRDDLDQLVRWQVRKSAPFPIDDACVTYTPGARGADGGARVRRRAGAPRRRPRVRRACATTPACTPGWSISPRSACVNLFARVGRRSPTGDWLVVHMRPDYTSIAIMRGGDVIFFRNRPEGDERVAGRPRAPDGDVLPGPAVGPGLRARAARRHRPRRPAPSTWRGGASRSGSASRSSRSIPTRAAPLRRSHQRDAGADGRAGAARRHAAADAPGGGDRLMLRTNLSTRPFYNVRAVQVALGAARRRRPGAHAVQRRPDRAPGRRASRRSAPARTQAEREAARLRAEAARIRAQINPQELQTVASAAREANAHHRPARVLVDRAVRPVRGDAARRRPHHRGAAAARGRHVHRRRRRRGAPRRGSRRVHRGARERRARSTTCSPPQDADQRGRAARSRSSKASTSRGRAPPLQAAQQRNDRLAHGMPLARRVARRAPPRRRAARRRAGRQRARLRVRRLSAVAARGQRRAARTRRRRRRWPRRSADHAQATGTLTGKDRASTELATFYKDVLPPDLSGARRLTYLRLRAARPRVEPRVRARSRTRRDRERDSTLTRLQIQMVLSGSYADMRDLHLPARDGAGVRRHRQRRSWRKAARAADRWS